MKKNLQFAALVAFAIFIFSGCAESAQNSAEADPKQETSDSLSGGQITDPDVVKRFPKKTNEISSLIELPLKVSFKKYCPEVTSQSYGTCYSYASVYAARTILYNIMINDTVNPTKNAFSPGFIQKIIYPRAGACRNNGADVYFACELIAKYGCVMRSSYPNDCSKTDLTDALYKEAAHFKAKSLSLFENCKNDSIRIQKIKTSLAERKPVIICIQNTDIFHSKSGNPDIWEPTRSEINSIECSSNHAMCIVGYDDNMYGGSFELMNSYGKKWKGDGFIWVKYADLVRFVPYALEMYN